MLVQATTRLPAAPRGHMNARHGRVGMRAGRLTRGDLRAMPLRIKLRADEKVIINGALISARQNTALIVHNHVSLLRERQILPPDQANTPARRIYFAVQCAYVAAPEEQQTYRDLADRYIAEFKAATTSERIRILLDEISGLVSVERYYEALRGAQEVVRYEDFVLKQQSLEPPDESADD